MRVAFLFFRKFPVCPCFVSLSEVETGSFALCCVWRRIFGFFAWWQRSAENLRISFCRRVRNTWAAVLQNILHAPKTFEICFCLQVPGTTVDLPTYSGLKATQSTSHGSQNPVSVFVLLFDFLRHLLIIEHSPMAPAVFESQTYGRWRKREHRMERNAWLIVWWFLFI
jgi:hypothetical protein